MPPAVETEVPRRPASFFTQWDGGTVWVANGAMLTGLASDTPAKLQNREELFS